MRSFWSNLGRSFHYKRSPILSFDHTSHFSPKTLSNSLPISLKFCLSLSLSRFVQQKKGRRRSEEASRKLSFLWVISLVLFLSFSPSLFSLSVTCSKEEKKKKKEKGKEKEMIFIFKVFDYMSLI